MGLQHELTLAGNWLFRWRSFLPVAMVACAITALLPLTPLTHSGYWCELLQWVFLGVSFLGLLVRVLTVGHTPARTSGRNTREQIAETLNTTGIYSTVRHPLYLGNFLIGLGLAAVTLNIWFVAVYILAFWLYYERIMLAEEAFLRAKFGERFSDWARVTPAFIPRLTNYTAPSLRFSIRNVLRREYSALLQIATVGFLLKGCSDALDSGHLVFSASWGVLLGVTTVLWAVLRALKRHTAILNVNGR
ncbi:MAG: methyltransferase family protein [Planctomycetota bacterium]